MHFIHFKPLFLLIATNLCWSLASLFIPGPTQHWAMDVAIASAVLFLFAGVSVVYYLVVAKLPAEVRASLVGVTTEDEPLIKRTKFFMLIHAIGTMIFKSYDPATRKYRLDLRLAVAAVASIMTFITSTHTKNSSGNTNGSSTEIRQLNDTLNTPNNQADTIR